MHFRARLLSPSLPPGSPFQARLITDLSTSCAIHRLPYALRVQEQLTNNTPFRGARAPQAHPASLPGKSRFAARSGWRHSPAHLTINTPETPPYGPFKRERTTFPQGFTLPLGKIKKNIHSMKKKLCLLWQSGSSRARRSFIDQSSAGLALCGFWRYPYRLSTRLSRPFVGNPAFIHKLPKASPPPVDRTSDQFLTNTLKGAPPLALRTL